MTSKFLFGISLLVTVFAQKAAGQTGHVETFREYYFSADDLMQYDSVSFEWNMDGPLQAELNEGINYLREKEIGASIGSLSKAISIDPNLWVSYYYRGISNKIVGSLTDAENDMKRGMYLNSNEPLFLLELGKIQQLKGNYDKARTWYDKYNRKTDDDTRGQYLLGNLNLLIRNLPEAKKNFQRCIKRDTTYADAFVKLGVIQMENEGSTTAGSSYFEKALAIDSTNVQALLFKGLQLVKEKPDESLRYFTRLIKSRPTNINFRVMRAIVLTDQHQYDIAFSDLQRAINEGQQNANPIYGSAIFLG